MVYQYVFHLVRKQDFHLVRVTLFDTALLPVL